MTSNCTYDFFFDTEKTQKSPTKKAFALGEVEKQNERKLPRQTINNRKILGNGKKNRPLTAENRSVLFYSLRLFHKRMYRDEPNHKIICNCVRWYFV